MKNKNILLLLTVFIAPIILASCNDFLDEIPDSRIEMDSPEKVAKLLVSAYPDRWPGLMFEFMSDNIADNGPKEQWRYDVIPESYLFVENQTATTYDTPHGVWESYYKAITTANTALATIEELEDTDDVSAHKAEALMCRAWGHFLLVNTFCQAYNPQSSSADLGIPYVEGRITDVFTKMERGTVKEVWDKINDDIEAALPHIDDNLYKQPKYHFNKKAAYAFAAEFNLYYGNTQKAIQYANLVLGENPTETQKILRDMTKTKIMSSSADIRNHYIGSKLECNLMIAITFSHMGRSVATGTYQRYALNRNIYSTKSWGSPGPWSGRTAAGIYNATALYNYNSYSYSTDHLIFFPKNTEIFEYTDVVQATGYPHVVWVPLTTDKVLLVRAEARTLEKDYDKAAEDLNMWYNAKHNVPRTLSAAEIIHFYAGETLNIGGEEMYTGAIEGNTKFVLNPRFAIEEGDQTAMINACLHARRIETVHEGWRWLDTKRYGIEVRHNVANQSDIVIAPWDKRCAIQIPNMVLSAGMEKNPR